MRVGLQRLIPLELERHVPASRLFYAARGARRGPASLAELTAVRDQLVAASLGADVAVERVIDPSGREVDIRVSLPQDGHVRAVHLDIPGGGFYLGPTAGGKARTSGLAQSLRAAVVSVHYRLAPENPWPAAPDDCEAAAQWLVEHAHSRFGTRVLSIGGSSAGATLASVVLLRLRDQGLADRFVAAALEFGTYDLSGQTPAGRLIAEEYFLEAYVGHLSDRTLPDVSPGFGDLRGLPPTLLVVGTSDVLLADNMAMAAGLAAAGNDVELHLYPESPHGFTGHQTGMAAEAIRRRDCWLSQRIST